MDERLEPDSQIGSNRSEPPALHSEKNVAIPAEVQASEGSGDQSSAKPSTAMLRRNCQVAQLATARKIKTRCRRIVDSADGAGPRGRCAFLNDEHPVGIAGTAGSGRESGHSMYIAGPVPSGAGLSTVM